MLLDYGVEGDPLRLFESASIVIYLGEKYDQFVFKDPRLKAEAMNWIMWQMAGQGELFPRPFPPSFFHPSCTYHARSMNIRVTTRDRASPC